MTNCTRCKGDGWIAGFWMPETCPECGGRGEFHVEPDRADEFDNDAAGCLVAAIGLALVLVIAAMWPAIEFFAAVLW